MKQNDFYYTKIPVAIVNDVEFGPGENMSGLPVLPNIMAWSACDDEELVERAAEIMAKICRLHGIAWTLSPVVDINMILIYVASIIWVKIPLLSALWQY